MAGFKEENAMKTDRPHDEAVIAMLRRDPALAEDYLATALDKAEEPGGDVALLAALRQIAEAQSGGIAAIAQKTGLSRETLYRILSPRGNPKLKTLLAIFKGAWVIHKALKTPPGDNRGWTRLISNPHTEKQSCSLVGWARPTIQIRIHGKRWAMPTLPGWIALRKLRSIQTTMATRLIKKQSIHFSIPKRRPRQKIEK